MDENGTSKALTDEEVIARAYGEALPGAEGTLDESASELLDTLTRMVGELAREGCPAIEDLVTLAHYRVRGKKRRRLEDHLRSCARCREELEVLRAWDAAASPGRWKRLRARLLPSPNLVPAMRGETPEIRRYRLPDGELLLTQWADAEGIRLVGTLQVTVPGMIPSFDQVEAILVRGGHEQERARLDSGGTFVLRPAKPGRYSIRIRWPGHEIHGIGITVASHLVT